MMRLTSVLIAILFSAACSGSDGDGIVEGPAAEAVADEAPYGTGAEIGTTYDYVLYVHCGVEWARIDGTWWQTEPLNDGNANPPPGWGNPYDEGELTLTNETTAEYSGPDGKVEFTRTDQTEPPFSCE